MAQRQDQDMPSSDPGELEYQQASRGAVRKAAEVRNDILPRTAVERLERTIKRVLERRSFGN